METASADTTVVASDNQGNKRKKWRYIGVALVVISAILAIAVAWPRREQPVTSTPVAATPAPRAVQADSPAPQPEVTAPYVSESYNMDQVNISGEPRVVDDGIDLGSDVLTIGDVRGELYNVKDGDKTEIRWLISIQTSRKARVTVSYVKSGEKTPHEIRDEYYAIEHVIALESLDADSVYKYTVKAEDLSGNVVTSDQFVFYTGVPNVSLIDVLQNAAQKVFGWAIGG